MKKMKNLKGKKVPLAFAKEQRLDEMKVIPAELINNTACGYGPTSVSLENKADTVITVPTVTLATNRAEQSPSMKSENKVFKYEDQEITFKITERNGFMINADDMAKPFGKSPDKFLQLKSTKKYLQILEKYYPEISNCNDIQFYKVVTEGPEKERGTWMYSEFAREFAHWLSSPKIKVWTYCKISELTRERLASNTPDLINIEKAKKLLEQVNLFIKAEEVRAELEAKVKKVEPKIIGRNNMMK